MCRAPHGPPLVLAQKVGKQRGFWAGFLLSFATAGMYSFYWNYKAHDELYAQFELQREHRDEGVIWLVLGALLVPFLLAYWWTMVGNVRYLRQRMLLPRSMTQGRFVALMAIGFGGFFAFFIAASLVDNAASTTGSAALQQSAYTLLGLAVVCFFATVPYAYWRLQADINDVWNAYEARMRVLMDPAAFAAPLPAAAQATPVNRYHADLAPAAPPMAPLPPSPPPAPPASEDPPR